MEGFNVLGKARTGILSNNEKKNATAVIPESGLVRKRPTRVETWLYKLQIMATKTSHLGTMTRKITDFQQTAMKPS